ncbi:VOC family protein [Marinoscillum sp. MHG1-6]|uniref:VOC family protein n=1 Tax=Marinoscillum sp. MHG1-6 TaxID=2959627 RepID=UPI0021572227|nr:VOC family protein [Marinoscillum sp. MHG1-6]
MAFEHFALNVESPVEVAQWYCDHLSLHLVFEQKESPYMRFLADETERVVMELYNNPAAPIMDHNVNHPLVFHVAFESSDAQADKERLEKAGAVFFEEKKPGEGTHLVMMRDPWGVPLQICQRKNRLNK